MLLSFFTFAQEESEEDALARMQAQLNGEVMSRPFLAERPKEVDNYIESMLKKNVKPQNTKAPIGVVATRVVIYYATTGLSIETVATTIDTMAGIITKTTI